MLNLDNLNQAYLDLNTTSDGDVLPVTAVAEDAGISVSDCFLWVADHITAGKTAHPELDEVELLRVLCLDLFIIGLAIGRRALARDTKEAEAA